MSAARWRLIANACLLLALGALAAVWMSYGLCVANLSDAMTRELNPLTEKQLEVMVATATAPVEEVPSGFGARAGLAHPVCIEAHPPGEQVIAWALFVFGLLGMFFGRNQARIVHRRNTMPDPSKGRATGVGDHRRGPLPEEIDVGDVQVGLSDRDKKILEAVGDLDGRDDSLMLYLSKKEDSEGEDVPRDIDGFFCPPGYHDKPILYVDPEHAAATDDPAGEDPVNNTDRPFATIEGAIAIARTLLEQDEGGVMIRVMPGVYHTSVDIPDRCVLVNHRMPAAGTARSRLKWLADQDVDQPDCVTILAPRDASYAVNFESGVRQGLFGCYVVGRENVKQAGVVGVSCRALALVNCAIESFTGGGIRLQDSGTELAGGAVMIHGCRIRKNVSKKGGGLYAERSAVSLADCVIEKNRAQTGGGVYGVDLRGPLQIKASRIAYNRAQLDESPSIDVDSIALTQWSRHPGLGGGVYLVGSRLKINGAEFVENGASVAGAGLALLNGKGIIESEDETRSRFARNKARIGGGIALVGWPGSDSTLKISDGLIQRNKATIGGGGLAVIGLSVAQLVNGEVVENEATDADGVGGGAVGWNGGEIMGLGVEFQENKSAGHGGGVAAINGKLAFKGDTLIRANIARKSGGGIYAITTSSKIASIIVERRLVKMPFSVSLAQVKISNNASTDLGGGMRGGNEIGVATAPLGFKLGEKVRFQLNRTKSQQENGDDVWVVWAGDVKGTDRDLPEKLVLR